MTAATPRRGRDQSALNFIDYALMGIGASLAAFTAGLSIGRTDTAQFLASGVLIGTALAYFVRTILGRTAVVRVDGILYAAAVGCAIIGNPVLNGFLPDTGFERDVIMAGILSWMLVLGSGLAWRDGTLLFQAIPSVALFGLIGCYDTVPNAPYLFFGFLLCLATVLARANRREMMRQAVMSGYFNRADAPSTPQHFPEQSPELYEDIRRGPWRWQAGPEWALASALVISLLSGLGAPVLQEAAKPITGAVRILAPPSVRNRIRGSYDQTQSREYTVGNGPNGSLSDHVLYQATLDRPRYLRTAAYETYTGRGWRAIGASGGSAGAVSVPVRDSIRAMGRSRTIQKFTITPTERTRQLPLPGEPIKIDIGQIRADGGGIQFGGDRRMVSGILAEPSQTPIDAPRDLPNAATLYDVSLVKPRVSEFAQNAARGATNDYGRARAIAGAIAAQVRYNIRAKAVPSGADPAEWFLFDNKEGYCDLFATAMTLSARSVGLPARYVVGFLPETEGNGAGGYVLREADYHAWCEVFFKDAGWVVFDATEGAAEVEGGERGSSDDERPWYKADWIAIAARTVLVLGAIVGGILALRGVKPKARVPRGEVHRAYARYESTLRKALGRRRHPGETIETYAHAAQGFFGGGVVELGRRFEGALYGPFEPEGDEIKGLREATKALRRP